MSAPTEWIIRVYPPLGADEPDPRYYGTNLTGGRGLTTHLKHAIRFGSHVEALEAADRLRNSDGRFDLFQVIPFDVNDDLS